RAAGLDVARVPESDPDRQGQEAGLADAAVMLGAILGQEGLASQAAGAAEVLGAVLGLGAEASPTTGPGLGGLALGWLRCHGIPPSGLAGGAAGRSPPARRRAGSPPPGEPPPGRADQLAEGCAARRSISEADSGAGNPTGAGS